MGNYELIINKNPARKKKKKGVFNIAIYKINNHRRIYIAREIRGEILYIYI